MHGSVETTPSKSGSGLLQHQICDGEWGKRGGGEKLLLFEHKTRHGSCLEARVVQQENADLNMG